MFEFSIAAKYLTPRWRQLSVSIISIVSILVIAVAVWLIVVFFSVTNGLTSSWIDKLIALTAPVRITPTPHYYSSYYHLIDGISANSEYNLKTIGEKRDAEVSNPYDASFDEEPPLSWPAPERHVDGSLKDPVQQAFSIIQHLDNIQGLSAEDYEITVGNLRLRLLRKMRGVEPLSANDQQQNFLSQSSYLGSLDPNNPRLINALASFSMDDLTNLLATLPLRAEDGLEESPHKIQLDDPSSVRQRLEAFFAYASIEKLKTPQEGWRLPSQLLPRKGQLDVLVFRKGNAIQRILIPQETFRFSDPEEAQVRQAILSMGSSSLTLKFDGEEEQILPSYAPLYIPGEITFSAKLNKPSIENAKDSREIRFNVDFSLQNQNFMGEIPLGDLEIAQAKIEKAFATSPEIAPLWIYAFQTATNKEVVLPNVEGLGQGVLLPKSFRNSGALLGDLGFLSYYAPTTSSIQEQRIPIYVAGFYDPGIIPIGGKYVLTSKEITTLIRSFFNHEEAAVSNGINVRFDNIEDADRVKKELESAFEQAGIAPYWKVETYRDFEFTRDIIQQLQSEKRLFTLLATLIIFVACSNIISMLIILVNDKKMEIGILRSMGASAWSIATIFGFCGIVMGAVGSLLGILLATLTLRNIQALVDFIGRLQGYEMFNPLFYGENLPTEISFEALTFVIIATAAISLIAGIIPAIKASLIKPATILKAE